ncbi:MAG TPA: hypothetical protein VK589_05045, partial [Chryseolinea sp.]|nr:hypothetical protein [Chryseolinea sp.]
PMGRSSALLGFRVSELSFFPEGSDYLMTKLARLQPIRTAVCALRASDALSSKRKRVSLCFSRMSPADAFAFPLR